MSENFVRNISILIYGCVQFVLCVPCFYGYAAVIFLDPVFQPYMPALAKLVIFSSMVHQIAMSLFSSLPFAIGQVQDAGLIFLSHMASSIAYRCREEVPSVIVSTTLVVLGLSTSLVGVSLVIIGRLKLARYISFLPIPVIGGYLAFIGFFCLEAGLTICTGTAIVTAGDFLKLITMKNVILITPALLSGVLFSIVSRRVSNIGAVLPFAMLAVPLIFYMVLGLSSFSLDDARTFGWVGQENKGTSVSEILLLYNFGAVRWDVIASQIHVWAGLVFVVAFGSSLDVAAIEMDLGKPLNINHELTTVGWGNLASGLLGGFTGSYIFSSTVFNYRTKIHSRTVGWILVFTEAAVFFWEGDPLAYVPLFFFASTLIFIAIELIVEWIFEVRGKLLCSEYMVLLLTFVSICLGGLEQGFLIGFAAAILRFVFLYARQDAIEFRRMKSRVVRPATERALLDKHANSIVTLQLHGEVFFGSSVLLLDQIKDLMLIQDDSAPKYESEEKRKEMESRENTAEYFCQVPECPSKRFPVNDHPHKNLEENDEETNFFDTNQRTIKTINTQEASRLSFHFSESPYEPSINSAKHFSPKPRSSSLSHVRRHSILSSSEGDEAERGPRFLVIDCSKLNAIDASAARNCFMPLSKLAESSDFTVVYASCKSKIEFLLKAHNALNEKTKMFSTVYEALDHCESNLLQAIHVEKPLSCGRSKFRAVFFDSVGDHICFALRKLLDTDNNTEDVIVLARHCIEETYTKDENIFVKGDESHGFYVILCGEVGLFQLQHRLRHHAESYQSLPGPLQDPSRCEIQVKLQSPSVFGYVDFQLSQQRSFQAIALENNTRLAFFQDSVLEQLLEVHPKALCRLQKAMLKASAVELSNLPSL